MRIPNHLGLALANGYILMFYSELAFWAKPKDTLGNWLFTWLAYSLIGFVFLALLRWGRVRSPAALFLTGAVFGWLTEGVIVQTMYDAFPWQISWTGLAWHALISVMFGWYTVRWAILQRRPALTLRIAALFGVAWAVWAIFWWIEPAEFTITPPLIFLAWSLAASLPLILAYFVFDRSHPEAFNPGRIPALLAAGALAIFFLTVTVPAQPLALAVLPPLLALVLLALWRNRRVENHPTLLEQFAEHLTGNPPAWQYLLWLVAPLTASAVYALAWALELHLPTNWLVFGVTTPAGFFLLAASLWKVLRLRSCAPVMEVL